MELLELHNVISRCSLCGLAQSRKNAVPGEGDFHASLMLVGEAPGRNEDLAGRPFVGAAGIFLDELLSSIGVDRKKVFITNIVKCRPPMNRPPRVNEVNACKPYLEQQMMQIGSRIVCLMGNNAIKGVLGKGHALSEMHGRLLQNEGEQKFFLTYHPAAALYVNELKQVMMNDFRELSKILSS